MQMLYSFVDARDGWHTDGESMQSFDNAPKGRCGRGEAKVAGETCRRRTRCLGSADARSAVRRLWLMDLTHGLGQKKVHILSSLHV